MKLFTKKETNTGRQFEFDLAKAICILGMVFVHCFEEMPLKLGGYSSSLYYTFVVVLDAIFGAGTFMICLGIGLAYTRNNKPTDFIKRGIVTFIIGYILNLVRFVIPSSVMFAYEDPIYTLNYLISCFLYSDIMQFAGLAFLLFGLLKKIKLPDWGIAIVAIVLSIAGCFLRFINTGSEFLNEIVGLFVGTKGTLIGYPYYAPFPIITWFIFPVAGYLFAKLLRRCSDVDKFYMIATPIAAVIVITFMVFAIPNRYGILSEDVSNYFQADTFGVFIIMMGALLVFGVYHFISKLFNDKVKKFITKLSSNINKTYCIHWVLIGWIALAIYIICPDGIENYVVLILGFSIYVVSTLLAEYVKRRSEKKKALLNKQKININTGDYNLSFFSLLKNRCSKSGQEIAYVNKNKEYSWTDIDNISSIIAKDLRELGVKKGTHVGIYGFNSVNWICTFFAIQKLGGMAVLINPKLKPKEVNAVCEIGDVTHLCFAELEGVSKYEFYKSACLGRGTIKTMYNISDSIDFSCKISGIFPKNIEFEDVLKPDDACLIIYTSGSTGKPKAVLSSAYGILYSLKPIINNVKQCEKDVNLGFLPFFHVFGLISSIVVPLLQGFCSIIPATQSPEELINLIEKHKVTLFNTVPTMILAIIANKNFNPEKLASLRSTILGGSLTTKDQMSLFKTLLPNNHFANVYGMSENASVSITEYNDSFEHVTETVGKPLDGTIVVIKDNNGNRVKDGEIGEICIKSGGMLVWYYKIPLEQQPFDDEGFLKTGDLGFLDKDGYVRLTGRIKELIISGGENISPHDVSEALLSLNYFSDAKVVGIPDPIKGEVVAAAVVLKPDYIWDEAEVKKELSEILAKYKMPVYYKIYKSFPILGTGKVDSISIIKQIEKEIRK